MAEADLKKGLTNPLPVDLTDKCTRLLGQICFTNSPIDPRAIRALSFLTDKVDISGSSVDVIDRCSRQLGTLCFGGISIDPRQIRNFLFASDKIDVSGSGVNISNTPDVNVTDRAARLLGIVYGNLAQLQQDVSRYLINIDIVHSKIHQGVGFHVDDLTLLVDIASPKKYLIITPNTSARAHMVFVVETEPGAKFEFFEDTTATDGAALTLINYKRDSATVSVLNILKDPTVTVDGTQILLWQSGTTIAGGKVGGAITHGDEFILKQNAIYSLKITPLSNNTTVFVHFNWYEVGI